MPFTNYAIDNFVAPEMSKLTQCGAPPVDDLLGESDKWISDLVLNSVLRFKIPNPQRQYTFYFARKTHGAVREYDAARTSILQYVSTPGRSPARYFAALDRFEVCVALTYHASLLLGRIVGLQKLYERADGSTLSRLNSVYVTTKHSEKVIGRGELPDTHTVPVWLTNSGLATTSVNVTFAEIVELLGLLAFGAGQLTNLPTPSDPVTETHKNTRKPPLSGDD